MVPESFLVIVTEMEYCLIIVSGSSLVIVPTTGSDLVIVPTIRSCLVIVPGADPPTAHPENEPFYTPEKWFASGKMNHFIHPENEPFYTSGKWSILYTGATCRDEEQEQPRGVPPWHLPMHPSRWFTFKWMMNFNTKEEENKPYFYLLVPGGGFNH